MKLTKQQEKEVLQEYNTYWDSYITGDVETMILLLDDDYNQIGSAESEVFFNKNDAIKFLYETIDQVAGKAEMRNRIIKVEPLDEYVLVNDLFDIYVLIETEWSFYSKFRASTLMQKKEEGWKFIHQHSSMPDTRTREGENIAIEKISAENLQLREAVKRRTVELENKNRELEIEAALERVRSIAMGMKKSDDLMDVSKALLTELNTLGFENIRNTQIDILNDEKRSFLNYEYSNYGVSGVTEVFYDSHPLVEQFVKDVHSGSGALAFSKVTGPDLDEWRAHRKQTNHLPDAKLDKATSLYYFCYSIGTGALGVSSFIPIADEKLEILKRFRNVFDLAYRRYSDIALAEAQARDAQIEVALERVRSRTMAMHDSNELLEAVAVFFQQFKSLGLLPAEARTYFCHINTDTHSAKVWMTHRDGKVMQGSHITPLDKSPSMLKFYEAWKSKEPLNIRNYSGKALAEYMQFLLTLPHVSKDEGYQHLFKDPPERIIMTDANFLQGNIGVMTFKPLSQEALDTLVRFAKVFELTYTRFLDLQKAEEQSREAQIEAALERVRAKTMAMHKSEELSETATVFFEQMHSLGELPDRIGISIINDEEKFFELWVTNQDGTNLEHRYSATIEEPTSMAKIYAAWKAKKDYIIIDLQGQELKKWIKFVREEVKMIVDDKNIKGRRIHNAAFFSNGVLLCTTHEPVKDEVIKLLVRFAKVFDQTYRRFLDLQKAEAQAREAEIQLALERVRARTMAMHNSHDVGVTVVTLFDEVLKLGLDKSIRCGIGILEGTEHMETWSATSYPNGEVDLKMGILDMTIHPMLIGLKKAWKRGETGYSYQYIGNDVTRYYNALNNEPGYPFFVELDSLPEKEFHNSFFFSEGILFAFTSNPISEEAARVLNRFASVFGQTYRRFLDLQKAEAQAREAQIEAALERVRTNAMAMQSSDDLAKIVEIVFNELKKVGFQTLRCGIGIIESAKTKKVDIWSTTLADDDLSIQIFGDEVLEGHPLLDGIIEHWVNQTEFSYTLEGDDFEKYYQTIAKTNFHIPEYSQNKMDIADEKQYYYMIPCKAGGLYAFSTTPFTDEVIRIMKRFIEVFQMAYTRYEDLKKAEEQNKIIQAENERKTKELEEARQLQLSMLPKELPDLPNLDIAVYMQTATEVGGDYYDFHVGIDGTLTVVCGDATGHGMKAGTVVTITKSLFNNLASDENILDSFSKISRVIKDMKFRQLAMCLLMLKIKENRLWLSSAAMPPALIYRKGTQAIDEILLKGMPLGAMNNFPYSLKESHLEKGDTVLILTDGLPELANNINEMYGYDRIKTEFHSVGEKAPEEIVEHLKDSASQWVNGKDPDDDVTFVVIKVK